MWFIWAIPGFEMTLNYQMTTKRYPVPTGEVGKLILYCEIFSLLDKLMKSPPTTRSAIDPTL